MIRKVFLFFLVSINDWTKGHTEKKTPEPIPFYWLITNSCNGLLYKPWSAGSFNLLYKLEETCIFHSNLLTSKFSKQISKTQEGMSKMFSKCQRFVFNCLHFIFTNQTFEVSLA